MEGENRQIWHRFGHFYIDSGGPARYNIWHMAALERLGMNQDTAAPAICGAAVYRYTALNGARPVRRFPSGKTRTPADRWGIIPV